MNPRAADGVGVPRRTTRGQTKDELYEQAQRLGIEGRSKMSKQQLARAVQRHG
ncbi:MAG TPA: Rho termination factor N-terminal domain-containing protein [Thermoanaerobaculia bacterium]|nr:Rho termination factor N-terminal domain-containing protein [Thermoanaerobaculia bacterium]